MTFAPVDHFKDRGIEAGIHTAERENMMGHKADGSSAIHKKIWNDDATRTDV